jgi:stage V sporulation protein G
MQITETRVKLMDRPAHRLKAFCSITLDNAFVVRELKVIEGSKGLFVSMPSRKITDHCSKCGYKNAIQAKFCNECGNKLVHQAIISKSPTMRIKLYADIAHPIVVSMRDMVLEKVLSAYKAEVERAKQPGYKSIDIDEFPLPGLSMQV